MLHAYMVAMPNYIPIIYTQRTHIDLGNGCNLDAKLLDTSCFLTAVHIKICI